MADFVPPPPESYVDTGFTPPPLDSFVPPHPSTYVPSPTPETDKAVADTLAVPEGSPEYQARMRHDLGQDVVLPPDIANRPDVVPASTQQAYRQGGILGAAFYPRKATSLLETASGRQLPEAKSAPEQIAKGLATSPLALADFMTTPEGVGYIMAGATGPAIRAVIAGKFGLEGATGTIKALRSGDYHGATQSALVTLGSALGLKHDLAAKPSVTAPEGEPATLTPPEQQTQPQAPVQLPKGVTIGEPQRRGHQFGLSAVDESGEMVGRLSWTEQQGRPKVEMVDVKTDMQRQGIGLALLNKLQEQYPGIEIIHDPVTAKGKGLVEKFKTQQAGGDINAQQPSDAQVQAGTTPLGEQARPQGEIPGTGSSDNVIGEAAGTQQIVDEPAPQEDVATEPAGVSGAETPPPAEPPVSGVSAGAFERTYGAGEIPTGQSMSPEDIFAQGKADLAAGVDPYSFAVRARTGDVSPRELGQLAAEHDRLVTEAAGREGTPGYEEAYQRAKDFAQNMLKPAGTKWHQVGMGLQIEAPVDFSNLTGFRAALEKRMGRDMTPEEAPAFQKVANDVAKAKGEAQAAGREAANGVQKRFARVKDITFEDAAKQIHDAITEAAKPCNL